MQPWKMFIRSVSVVTLITAGGFAAGQAVVPFANASRGVSPAVEEEAPETEAPEVDPAAEVDETTTTTTEAPAAEAPSTDAPSTDPVVDPEPTKPPAEEAPESSTPTTTAAPVEITVVDPAPAAPAAPKAKKAKKEKTKGDHNCDGKLDNGWYKKRNDPPANHTYPEPRKGTDCVIAPAAPAPAPAAAPASAPAPASPDKGRSATAPGHTKTDRSGPASGQDNNRPASAGQMKKAV